MEEETVTAAASEIRVVIPESRATRPGLSRRILRNWNGIVGAGMVGLVVGLVVLSPALGLPDPLAQDLASSLLPPGTPGHPFGTDQFGRDLLSRIVWGGRISIIVGIVASIVAVGSGVPLGMLSGILGGRWDFIMMRLTDVMLAFPYILLALVIVSIIGPGLLNSLIAVAITNVPFYIRVMRGVVVTISHQAFVEASVALGATTGRVLRKAILPALMPYITVGFSINVGWLILETAGLSFLGLGAQPPLPEWGAMLAEGRTYIVIAPHVVVIPGLAIFLLVLGLNLVGDAVRDVLDVELS